jgi:type I restriction enzyme M protein
MALKKSEIYRSLWESCDELRGGMDASQYKDYILVLLFIKYVSDKYAGKKDAPIVVPKGGSFADIVALKNKKGIGEGINTIIAALAKANDLTGVIDEADFDDETKLGKPDEMVDKLTKLVGIFQDLDLGANRAEGDDLLGDAYEYLMRNFATQSGKSKGQFYTPSEVSRIMAKVIGISEAKRSDQTIYDPTCGSGSLLLKAHDESPKALSIYGQEMDKATRALAKMNMILHGCPDASIWQDNTLSLPHFKDKNGKLKTFDFVVANPPFSWKAWTTGFDPSNDPYERFPYGIPPKKKGDYAFLMHVLGSLKNTGKGAIILPHGVLFRGDAEGIIRKAIIQQGFIKAIIGLPANLFYGTGIPACIIVLDKENANARRGIFMIDASKRFIKDGNKNRLRAQDIHKIVDAFEKQAEISKYSRMVPLSEITESKNDFNLNIPRYIDSTVPEDLQNISGHLLGGIPDTDIDALSGYFEVLPSLKSRLFKSGNRKGFSELKVEQTAINQLILDHSEFKDFNKSILETFSKWKQTHQKQLKTFGKGDHPKKLIQELSESLLEVFKFAKLIDPYDLYQHLMNYWVEVMQDDTFMIVSVGWKDAAKPRPIIESKDKKNKEKPDLTVGKAKLKAELLPPDLIVGHFFQSESSLIIKHDSEIAALEAALVELIEENSGDEGLLSDLIENEKIKKADVILRLKEIKGDIEADEERKLLDQYIKLTDKSSDLSRAKKDLEKALAERVLQQYGKLTENEIIDLVVEEKWLGAIEAVLKSELDKVSQNLSDRIGLLSERYSTPLPILSKNIQMLSSNVDEHLRQMGFTW